jgi:hypothetical protein
MPRFPNQLLNLLVTRTTFFATAGCKSRRFKVHDPSGECQRHPGNAANAVDYVTVQWNASPRRRRVRTELFTASVRIINGQLGDRAAVAGIRT